MKLLARDRRARRARPSRGRRVLALVAGAAALAGTGLVPAAGPAQAEWATDTIGYSAFPGTQSLPNTGVTVSADKGVHQPNGFLGITSSDGWQTWTFSPSAIVTLQVRGLGQGAGCLQFEPAPTGAVVHGNHSWDGGHNLCRSGSGNSADSYMSWANVSSVQVRHMFGGANNRAGVAAVTVQYNFPVAWVSSPVNGGSYAEGSSPAIGYGCSDGMAGVSAAGTFNGSPVSNGASTTHLTPGSYTVAVTCTDGNGVARGTSIGFSVHNAPPQVSIASPAGDVNVDDPLTASYSCSDRSLASCTAVDEAGNPVASGDAIDTWQYGGRSLTVTATDAEGATATQTVNYAVLDVTPPTVSIVQPSVDVLVDDVLVAEFSCDDRFLASCTAVDEGGNAVASGDAIDTWQYGDRSLTVTGVDESGNTTTQTVDYAVLDVTPPTVSIVQPSVDVLVDDVLVAEFSCDDRFLASCTAVDEGGNAVASGDAIDTWQYGDRSLTVTGVDESGNTTTERVDYRVLDVTPPEVTIAEAVDGATYLEGGELMADFSCTDRFLASCTAVDHRGDPVGVGDPLPVNPRGTYTITVTGIDESDNTTVVTHEYLVDCPKDGIQALESPVSNLGLQLGLLSSLVDQAVTEVVGELLPPLRTPLNDLNCDLVEDVVEDQIGDPIAVPLVDQLKASPLGPLLGGLRLW